MSVAERFLRGLAVFGGCVAVLVLATAPRSLGSGGMPAKGIAVESYAPGTSAFAAGSPQLLRQGRTIAWWERRAQRNQRRFLAERRRGRMLQSALRAAPSGTHWLESAFLCIHRFEGSWTDPNAPYYGGLQMDMSFQRSYGGVFLRAFGTADNWPVSVQLAVAIEAYLSGRGFGPWPNTRKECGL